MIFIRLKRFYLKHFAINTQKKISWNVINSLTIKAIDVHLTIYKFVIDFVNKAHKPTLPELISFVNLKSSITLSF